MPAPFEPLAAFEPFRVRLSTATPPPIGFERFMVRKPDDSGWEPFQVRKPDNSGWEDFQVRKHV
jgi:hypothetical protein